MTDVTGFGVVALGKITACAFILYLLTFYFSSKNLCTFKILLSFTKQKKIISVSPSHAACHAPFKFKIQSQKSHNLYPCLSLNDYYDDVECEEYRGSDKKCPQHTHTQKKNVSRLTTKTTSHTGRRTGI